MSRFKLLFTLIVSTLLLSGCEIDFETKHLTEKSNFGELTKEYHQSNTNVKMYLNQQTFRSSVEHITFYIKNTGLTTLTYGTSYTVEKYKNGSWLKVPFEENVGWTAIAILLRPDEKHKDRIATELLNYRLTKGKYRVVKQLSVDGKQIRLAANFEIN